MKQFSIKGAKSNRLEGKRITLCVTGSVACARAPELARELMRHGADVTAIMSDGATELIHPNLMQWACEKDVVTSLTGRIEHVRLGAYSDLVLVCPATANTISKIACGIDDTPVTSTVSCALGAHVPVILVPAMHESMYEHLLVAENIAKLKKIGVEVVEPRLEEGKAKIAWNEDIINKVIALFAPKDLTGMKLVITGGPTYEKIDECRGIINRSSGKMACAIASNAKARGAHVTLVYGPAKQEPPKGVELVRVESTAEMTENAMKALAKADALVSVAAMADYRPGLFKGKLDSRKDLTLGLKKNEKLVALAKKKYPRKAVVAFKLGEEIDQEKALEYVRNGMDLVVADALDAIDADDAEVMITDGKRTVKLHAGKDEIAKAVLDELKAKLKRRKR